MTFNNSFKDHFDNYFNKLSKYFNSEILISIEKLPLLRTQMSRMPPTSPKKFPITRQFTKKKIKKVAHISKTAESMSLAIRA